MLGKEAVEGGKVAGFLGMHVFQKGPEGWMGSGKGWGLVRIDQGCGELAGLIDAKLVTGLSIARD